MLLRAINPSRALPPSIEDCKLSTFYTSSHLSHATASQIPRSFSSATMTDLRLTLSWLELGHYYDRFIQAGFDSWETIMEITEDDLQVSSNSMIRSAVKKHFLTLLRPWTSI